MKIKKLNGFTLLELMITVAIIGILSAIALPSYQGYVTKSIISASIRDIVSEKTKIEMSINENVEMSLNSPYSLSYSETTNCSTINIVEGTVLGDTVTLQCTMKGNNVVEGKKISFTRDRTTGHWECISDIELKYLPPNCKN